MINIFKGLIDLIVMTIGNIYNIQIPLFNDKTVPLGMIILSIAFVIIVFVVIFNVVGINLGGDD